MSFIRESQPGLVSPDYWSGIDIHDDTQFKTSTALSLERRISLQASDVAGAVLTQRLGQAIARGCSEESLGEWVSKERPFEPGDVVVIEKERLVRMRFDSESGQRLAEKMCTYEANNALSQGTPITHPYMDYWQRSQEPPYACEGFGIERAYLPSAVEYMRCLSWGVYFEAARNKAAFVLADFDAPRLASKGVELSRPALQSGYVLPFETGVSRTMADTENTGVTKRAIERIKRVSRLCIQS